MLSAVSLPQPSQPQSSSTRRATTSSSSSSSSSVLQRGRSAAMKKLRSLAAAPESPPRATEPFPRAAPPAGDGAPSAGVVGALLGRGEAARDARRHHANAQAAQHADAHAPHQRRRDLCTPSAEVEEWLQRCSAMAEFEMSVAVGCGVFGGVDYHGVVVRGAEGGSEGEREEEFVDCRAEEEHGAV